MTITRVRGFTLTDGRSILDKPLIDLTGKPDIEYRDRLGEAFRYTAAELIAAGYTTVPDYLTIDAVYILRLRTVKKQP